MKTCVLAALFTVFAGAALADPIEGLWQTQEDDGAYAHVNIAPCGPNFCGKIVESFKAGKPFASENVGKMIVIDMAAQGDGEYKGKVYRPSNDKTYLGKVSLNGKDMKLAGCVFGGLFCAKQSWTKIK